MRTPPPAQMLNRLPTAFTSFATPLLMYFTVFMIVHVCVYCSPLSICTQNESCIRIWVWNFIGRCH